ncbi:MAG: DUF1353 domain-containing protein [Phenylobacterium sp.]|nr:DUF1353 domain-containing protein [Phenylobacterium sp.]
MRRLARILAAALLTGLSATPVAGQQVDPAGASLRLMRETRIEGRRALIVTADLLYCYPPTKALIVVPTGYVTDFASVPAAARSVISEFGDQAEAAIVHDWLYAVGEPDRRLGADQVFRFAMREQGVSAATAAIAYNAVRWFGGGAYGRPDEWLKRFGDPQTGRYAPPPIARPSHGVVATLASCDLLEQPASLAALKAQYGSALWPRAAP